MFLRFLDLAAKSLLLKPGVELLDVRIEMSSFVKQYGTYLSP